MDHRNYWQAGLDIYIVTRHYVLDTKFNAIEQDKAGYGAQYLAYIGSKLFILEAKVLVEKGP